MATAAQVAHYSAMAAEAAQFFGLDNRERNANRQAMLIASYRRMQAKREAMPAPQPLPDFEPSFAYDFDDNFTEVPLSRFLVIHAADDVLCQWARTAGLGERRSGVRRVL